VGAAGFGADVLLVGLSMPKPKRRSHLANIRNRVRLGDPKLYAPRPTIFWIALICGLVAIVSYLGSVPFLSDYAFWLLTVGFGLLVASVLIRGF
jgi:hypothetical protein